MERKVIEGTVESEKRAEEEFKRQLLDTGLVSQLPTSPEDADDAPVAVAGEPVSETILGERRSGPLPRWRPKTMGDYGRAAQDDE